MVLDKYEILNLMETLATKHHHWAIPVSDTKNFIRIIKLDLSLFNDPEKKKSKLETNFVVYSRDWPVRCCIRSCEHFVHFSHEFFLFTIHIIRVVLDIAEVRSRGD